MSRPTREEMVGVIEGVLKNIPAKDQENYVANVIMARIQQRGMTVYEYKSSGCLHSMRESCNCQGEYIFGFQGERE